MTERSTDSSREPSNGSWRMNRPTRAAVDRFRVTLHGKQTHGAIPQGGIDPIVMAAQAVMALQTIRSRTLDPLAPSVVTVGILRSGERFNIIPADAYLEGTVRTYGGDVEATVEKRMREIFDGISKAMGGSYEMNWEQTTPATVNTAALEAPVRRSLEAAMGPGAVHTLPPTLSTAPDDEMGQRPAGVLLRPRHARAGRHLGRPAHADLPRAGHRRRRGHEGDEPGAGGLPLGRHPLRPGPAA